MAQRGGVKREPIYSLQYIYIYKGEQGLNVARKFLCLAAQGNIDLTCNYWKGRREGERGGKDVELQTAKVSDCMNETPQRRS